ncbi:MAG: HPr(Ser) kinase/phosphatase [Treponema sp.]|jgi:HPr kinase/phosphorylase|nr:HPr(Ser) kinase/phosphatase [Treponema sp.]
MAVFNFTVLDLIDIDLKEHNSLDLICLGGRKGLNRYIPTPELNRPGLALSGFFELFAYQRVQVFGRGENAYLEKLMREEKFESIREMFTYAIPCCIFTCGQYPNAFFFTEAEKKGCPVLQTTLNTSEFESRLIRILSNIFSPRKSIHGVLMEVFGLGVLLTGDSGVGKSETALELIKKGHRLVADDIVDIHCINGNILMGMGGNKIIGHHMEIRGLGVINITHLFGIGAVRDQKQVQLVIELETWEPDKNYDRLGLDKKTTEILGVSVTKVEIPVKIGRNVPVIVETAAMNERLRKMGYDAAKEFNQNIMKWQESGTAKLVYFGEDII